MAMRKNLLITILIIMLVISGCNDGYVEQGDMGQSEKNHEEMLDEFNEEDDIITESSGMLGFGFTEESPNIFDYNGENIEIPYYIENMGKEGERNAKVGLVLFVNGESQPFSVMEKGKTIMKESIMQKFNLSVGERKEITLSFSPVSGQKGEDIGVIPATIWNPDYIPQNNENPNFGNCLQLSANIPLTIRMRHDSKNSHKLIDASAQLMDIPEEILAKYEGVEANGVYDILDNSMGFDIVPSEKDKRLLKAKEGKIELILNIYGGAQVTNKITLFLNNNPIVINGGNYVQVDMKKGKMWQIKLTLDAKDCKEKNTIYAVAMTSGNDYEVQDIKQAEALLLLNN